MITLSPFKLQSFFKEDLVLSANSQSLMNFEKYQRQEVTQPILHENNTQKTFDATNPILEDSQDIDLSSKDHSKFHEIIPRGPSSVAIDFEFINSADLMGIPSHADSVHLKDTTDSEPYRLFNVDSYEFPLGSKNSLYGSVPFMVSINYQENSAGVFWINTSETWIDIETLKYSKTTH